MAKIAFIILAHEYPDDVAELAIILTSYAKDTHVIVHYDVNSPLKNFFKIKFRLINYPQIHVMEDRIKSSWGDFSLVKATVRALNFIRSEKINCTHVTLVSGSCMPIRPLMEFSLFLDHHPDQEFIEIADSSWIIGGLREERYQYWHFFNHQKQHYLFNHHYRLQKKILPKRKLPHGLHPRFGSQWWCLTWNTCEKILDYIKQYPLKYVFFATTWIPDELFFQTLVFYLIPSTRLTYRNLTLFYFNKSGKPLIFYDEHLTLLTSQPYFFARKISHSARFLRSNLKQIALSQQNNTMIKIDYNYRFPYGEEIAKIPRAGLGITQLFQNNMEDHALHQDTEFNKSFVILYGPPMLTVAMAQVLRAKTKFEIFGRLFAPGKIDFGNHRQEFCGLHEQEYPIRDLDPINYLARVLRRTHNFPVFELCPGENLQVERALLNHPQALILAILPNLSEEFAYRLFKILGVGTLLPAQKLNHSYKKSFSAVLREINEFIPKSFRSQMREFIKSVRNNHESDLSRWGVAIGLIHQASASKLVSVIPQMEERLAQIENIDLIATLPESWKITLHGITALNLSWKILRPIFPVIPEDVRSPLTTTEAQEKNTHQHKAKKLSHLMHVLKRLRYSHQLYRIINRGNKISKNAILLVTCLNREYPGINFFCEYYRNLGVNHFLFIVNYAIDNLRDWARKQSDVSLWGTQASYLDAHYGIEWCNYLLNKYGSGHLCVTVNPDEFLIYPKMDTRNLDDLGRFLKMEKLECLHTITLEAYNNPALPNNDPNPFNSYPYFDRDGYIQSAEPSIPLAIRGGPTMRMQYVSNPKKSPLLNKIPVVWWCPNFHYLKSTRELFPRRVMTPPKDNRSLISGALFRFPAVSEDARPDLFRTGISIRYKSPLQLIKLGLISQGNWI